jgi:hypothetical protein
MSSNKYEPASTGMRKPTDNSRVNGRVVNPPRFAELGGLTSGSKALTGNNIKIHKPGGGAK